MGLDMYLYAQRNLPDDFGLEFDERREFERDNDVFVPGYKHNTPEAQERYREIVAGAGLTTAVDPETPHVIVVSDEDNERDGFAGRAVVAYWRKANQVHRWFVVNAQKGVDDCGYYVVPRAKLDELRVMCETLLALRQSDPESAERRALEDLPPLSGFFFGHVEVDDWYWEDIADTVKQLDRVLAETPHDATLTYHSSW